jgi:hypothetical protein
MPSLTPADALIQAADNLTTALAGVIPPPSMTTKAIAQLISIFKTQAEKEKAHENIHYSFYVTSHIRFSMTKQETFWNIGIYSSTQNIRTCGANLSERKSDDWQQSLKQSHL